MPLTHTYTQGEMEKSPLLIAMKGHPGTGKSTLACSIAAALRCPYLDKDDVRDQTRPIEKALEICQSNNNKHDDQDAYATDLLNDVSYSVLWSIAETQLKMGLSVVIDCPLARAKLFERVLELASKYGARLLVIECRPKDEREWRRRLEERGRGGEGSWHKPCTWERLERLIKGYDGCWEYGTCGVPKLVVDTTAKVERSELILGVLNWIALPISLSSPSPSHFPWKGV
ncbi:hypothetical protein AMTRI_Chr02g255490 [Amborella trichopoda]